MRITESRLRRIIRSVIAEGEMSGRESFNQAYVEMMREVGSEHYSIEKRDMDYYEKLRNACKKGYTSYGIIDERKDAKIFQNIGCDCEWFGGDWFTKNASNIISCLKTSSEEQRKEFFNMIEALLS